MKPFNRTYPALILAALAMPVFAQGVAHSFAPSGRRYHIDDRWILSGPQRPETEYLENEKRVRSGVFDQRAGTILNAAQAYTKAVFAFRGLELRNTATYTQRFSGKDQCDANSDTLMVEWAVNGDAGAGTLILADDPMVSTYTLRISRAAILSIDDLTSFLAGVLVAAKPPLRLVLTDIDFALPPPPGISAFLGRTFRSSVPSINDVEVQGSVREGYCYLLVQVGKGLTRDSYPMPPFIPERFPPLADQVGSWSFERIRSEVGKGGCFDERNLVLLTELAKRGLTTEQFVDILVNTETTDPHGLAILASAALRALSAVGKAAALEGYMGPALDAYYRMGPHGEEAAAELFRTARWKCSPAFERIAVKHASGPFPAGPIAYLDMCSTSKESLETLEQVSLPSGLDALRDHAVRSISKRVAKATGR
jgi:hypothetical protein